MRSADILISLTLAMQFGYAQVYFPPGVLARTPQASEVAANQCSIFLKSLHEPSLWELAQHDPSAEAYRLLWLQEFDRPASVRFVRKPGGTGWFYRRMTGGRGGAKPGRMTEYGMSWFWKSRTSSFLSTVESLGFWNLPTLCDADGNAIRGCPAHWIVEGIKNGQYHVVDRCSPEQTDPVRAIGMLAMKLGNLRVHRSDLY